MTECPESLPAVVPIQEDMADGEDEDDSMDTSGSDSHQAAAAEALEDGADQVGVTL